MRSMESLDNCAHLICKCIKILIDFGCSLLAVIAVIGNI